MKAASTPTSCQPCSYHEGRVFEDAEREASLARSQLKAAINRHDKIGISSKNLQTSEHGTASKNLQQTAPYTPILVPNTERSDDFSRHDGYMSPDGKHVSADGRVLSLSFAETTVNISKAFMGASSFSLPWAFSQAGYIGSIVGITFIAFLSNVCFATLIKLSNMVGIHKPTYPQIGQVCMGSFGEGLVWLGMALMTIGVVGSYFLFAGQIVASLSGISLTVSVLSVALAGTGLSLFKSNRILSKTSAIGLIALAFSFVAVGVDIYSRGIMPPLSISFQTHELWRWPTYPLFLGVSNFLFLISTAVLPLDQSMHPIDRRNNRFHSSFTLAQVLVTLVNVPFALAACLAYMYTPHGILSNVLLNLPGGLLTSMVQLLMAVNQLLTVPLFLIPMATAFESRMLEQKKDAFNGEGLVDFERVVCRLMIAIAAALLALRVPCFGLLTGITGAFGNNMLAFIFVPVFYMKRCRDLHKLENSGQSAKMQEVFFAIFTFTFGVIIMIFTTISTYNELDSCRASYGE